MEGMNKAWEGASQEMYAASQAAGAQGGEPGPDAGAGADQTADADVSDVEFEEVEDKK